MTVSMHTRRAGKLSPLPAMRKVHAPETMVAFIAKDNGGADLVKRTSICRVRVEAHPCTTSMLCQSPPPADHRVSVILTTTATFASITTAAFTVKRTTRIVHEKWIYRTHEQL